jgi:outer membrane phospholipase A
MVWEKHQHEHIQDSGQIKDIKTISVHELNGSKIKKSQDWESLCHRLVFVIGGLEENPLNIKQWHKVFDVIRKYEDMCRG